MINHLEILPESNSIDRNKLIDELKYNPIEISFDVINGANLSRSNYKNILNCSFFTNNLVDAKDLKCVIMNHNHNKLLLLFEKVFQHPHYTEDFKLSNAEILVSAKLFTTVQKDVIIRINFEENIYWMCNSELMLFIVENSN